MPSHGTPRRRKLLLFLLGAAARKRCAMCALYAFFRRTDDLSDDGGSLEERRAALQSWRESLRRALTGTFDDPLLPAVADVVLRYGIPVEYLGTSISGVESDLMRTQITNNVELEQYCYQVASVVGLACMHVWGFRRDPRALEAAHRCGLAFQFTNILRDVREDAQRGRIYLPLDLLEQHAIDPAELLAAKFDERARAVVRILAAVAEDHYRAAAELTPCLSDDGRRSFGAMWSIYHELLVRIRAAEGDVFSRRIRVPGWRKTAIALRHMLPRFVPFLGSRKAGSLSPAP
ncbi:MAG: phytoene/squalene synthase family protein [Pirellulales bacterium]